MNPHNIKWNFKSTNDTEIAEFTVGKLKASVQDCDGDFSMFVISSDKETLVLSDAIYDCPETPYHFYTAKEMCIEKLIEICRPIGLYKDGN